jgi:uncharacterized membrane protein
MNEISKERVGALSDGVIAIAATILVLELKVPEGNELTSAEFLDWARIFVGWIVSFAMIAVLWFDNHYQMRNASHLTIRMTVLMFANLALMSLIPFASSLIMEDHQSLVAAVIFNIVMLANGLCSAFTTLTLLRSGAHVCDSNTARMLRSRAIIQGAAYVGVAACGLFGAVVHHPFIGVLLWLIMPIAIWIRFNRTETQSIQKRKRSECP